MNYIQVSLMVFYVFSHHISASTNVPTDSIKEKPHDTPPPNLQTTTKDPLVTDLPTTTAIPPTISIIPPDQPVSNGAGSDLAFEESGHEKTFLFAKNNTFIQMDGDLIQTFQLRLCREISFQFRTRLPHGLLVYHNVKNPDGIELDPYALYVIVEKGQLKVVHVFGKHSTSVTVGEGLNRDEWHSVMVRIDVHGARLIARVDDIQEEVYLKGLNHDTNYGVSTNLPSVVLVGGLSSEEKLHGVKYIIESFVGCIRNVVLSSGKAASDLLPITNSSVMALATKHENVKEGCFNKCHTQQNLCFVGSKCINHYYDISCNCFGTHYEGEQCDIYTATILTLRGSSYVSYRIYDWKDRVHSPKTRISLMFKTRFDDSALFYASGESVKHQYIAASIKNHSLNVEMDFGDGVISCQLGDELTSHYWHNLTIYHERNIVRVVLDDQMKIIDVPGTTSNLLFDPEIYFGGGPDLHKKKGLSSNNNFAGSLKYVYYNDISVLYELKNKNPKVHYIGVLEAEFYEADIEVIPITFPFATSHIWWPINQPDRINIKFDFRSNRTTAVLAYGEVTTSEGNGFWEIRLANDELSFDFMPDVTNNITNPIKIPIESATKWHSIELSYKNGEIKFTVDYRKSQSKMFGLSLNMGHKVIIGSSLRTATSGLIGCMRDLEINDVIIEPRFVVKTERVVGEVALDNCKYIDPCKRPNTCEHGGKCFVKDDRITCDCLGTGYIGKNCHFTKYRKTCEELALLGYTKPDVYLIDIDGNGVFPPAHVKCDFQSLENATKTIVEHNLPSQFDVRSAKEEDFSINIKYREFSPEMLQELVSHSLYCTQNIKYDCYKAPLELHSFTWFTSSDKNNTVDYLGDVKRGSCPCSLNHTCQDPNQTCNCDVKENKWFSDEGFYESAQSLGITNMYFLQQKDLDEEAKGRITLGPLECVETNTQKFVVTFTTSQSYIEVPGWRKGDIAFSFRTTGEKAILLFQPPIRAYYPSFMVALTGDYQLTFNFTLSTGTTRELVINSNRKLNGGEWHKIWIDYNEYHVRFMINTDYQMIELRPEEEFGPFEGSMFIGGATADLLKKLSVKQGLIGCFRGLVVNGEILDIYNYMSVHLSEIIKDCKPSCVPNPCKNGAHCRELWSTFQCVCNNKYAHVGQYCETNINEKALTFINRESYLKRNYLSNATDNERNMLRNIFKENMLINIRTYDSHSLVLYANDHFNNFVHLYITNSNEVVYLYNYGDEIVNLTIVHNELSSGKSIQVAVIRTETETTMHVNEKYITVEKGFRLLEEYSNRPWVNPEKELLHNHRPPAPPTEYFQFNVGGYDTANLLRTNSNIPELQGFIGCVRGLKIGDNLIDLAVIAEENIARVSDGVLSNCQVKCDAEPCKNGGICTENFAKQESYCNCEHTSFMGEFCMEEKGADFSGESALKRKYILEGKVEKINLQLAFSSGDFRRASRVMLLLQSENDRSYYLMVAITADGFLQFEEDREGSAFGAIIARNFLNNIRHSVYYQRTGDDAVLLIDREEVPLEPIVVLALTQVADVGSNSVQIGGINTTDPRFAVFKSYSGCLSNIFIQVNNYSMKPLEEYMLFTNMGAENITVINSQGVRSAQCSMEFDITQKFVPEPSLNFSVGSDKTWVENEPERIPFKSQHVDPSQKEEKTQVVFITLTTLFVVIVICCIIEVYRTNRAHRKRIERETDESIIWSKEQATKMFESPNSKAFIYQPVSFDESPPKGDAEIIGILKNGSSNVTPTTPSPVTNGNEYKSDSGDASEDKPLVNGIKEVSDGVLSNCQVKCDAEPCKNGGICTENFAKQESYCNCEHTSFMGEFCMEEKGADFSGESALKRKYILEGKVEKINLQLAFSSGDFRRASRVMLLLQSENDRSYYLMVAITADGFLQFEEDREGSAFGAIIARNFLNNIRHSVYYQRTGDDAVLLIDREEVPLEPIVVLALTQVADVGSNSVQIGGINTTDPRFAVFKSYSGCLSNIFIQVNNYSMKPLEEYMLFTNMGAENITVINSQGVRSAQCSMEFDITQKFVPEPSLNFSVGSDKTWVENEPERIPFKSQHVDPSQKEEKTQVVFITLTTLFVVIVICCIIEVYRTNRAHRKRIERETDESIIWSKEQATKMFESPNSKAFIYQPVSFDESPPKGDAEIIGILKNGSSNVTPTTPSPVTNGNEYKSDSGDASEDKPLVNGIKEVSDGVLSNCQVKCDAEPCKNGGICTENFAKQESYCNCEHTSFMGEFCMEEKGADFSGESALKRKYILEGKVEKINLQLAFSSGDFRRASRVMLLLQSENDRSYYLMVAITADGFLQFEEDREGSAFGAIIARNFLNNIRHSVYYQRTGDDAVLLIDREEVPLEPIVVLALTQVADVGSNSVQIGGINTTDPRFAVFKSYSGCLSNIFIQVNNYSMKPLEEYMLFTNMGAENITVINSQGVRSAQCSMEFDITQKFVPEPSLNFSVGSDKTWVENEPERIPFKSQHVDPSQKEEKTQVVFITLTTLFVVIVICCIIEVYRTNRAHRKRIERETDESIIWSKEQATKMFESPNSKAFIYQPVSFDESPPKGDAEIIGILKNGSSNVTPTTPSPVTNGNEYKSDSGDASEDKPLVNGIKEGLEDKVSESSIDDIGEHDETASEEDETSDDPDDYTDEFDYVPDLPQLINRLQFSGRDAKTKEQPQQQQPNTLIQHDIVVRRQPRSPITKVFVSEDQRQFDNPISYLGGPHLEPRNRKSLDSVLSID